MLVLQGAIACVSELEQEKSPKEAAQMRNRVAAISLVGLAGLTSFAFFQWNEAA